MRKIVLAGATTLSGLVLLMAYPTSTNRAVESIPGASSSTTQGTSSGTTPATAQGTSSGTGTPAPQEAAAPPTTSSISGPAVSTRWGTVQVQITVTDGVLTEATAIKVPDANGQDRQINSYAVPILEAESVAAGNARIDAVSGATVTSTGYIRSLQAALDEAGLK